MSDKVEFTINNVSEVVAKIVKAWQNIGEDIFDLSQVRCPVDEGTLQMTGAQNSRPTPTGYTIVYRTSYAAVQEFGTDKHQEKVIKHHVRKHKRKTLVHKKFVVAHDRGPFIRTAGPREGKHFLGSSYDEFKPRLTRVLVKYIGDVT